MRAYEHRHIVGFEETNLVGNVYFVNHLRWQGRCREMFLREFAPGVLDEMAQGLCLITTRCSCEYLAELSAFDPIVVRMRLGAMAQNRLTMSFEYWRARAGEAEALVARGEQQIAFMRRDGAGMVPAPVPEELRVALRPFGGS
jgi:enediyne biosynthesis thioesterase